MSLQGLALLCDDSCFIVSCIAFALLLVGGTCDDAGGDALF